MGEQDASDAALRLRRGESFRHTLANLGLAYVQAATTMYTQVVGHSSRRPARAEGVTATHHFYCDACNKRMISMQKRSAKC